MPIEKEEVLLHKKEALLAKRLFLYAYQAG
jgi:hypothetical protein